MEPARGADGPKALSEALRAAQSVPGAKRVSFESRDLEQVRAALQADEEQLAVRPEPRRKQPSIVAHALSGMMGSVAAECILFPVDTLKLIIQTSSADSGGIASTLARIVRTQGVGGLYKGIGVSVFKESIHSLNYWLWHGFLFRSFARADDTSKTPASTRLVLNLVAKQLNWVCTVPFEVIASVNQLAPDSPGFFATAARLYRRGGLGSFYRGLALSMTLAINPAIMNTLITSLLRIVAAVRMVAKGLDHEMARNHGPAVIGFATAVSKFVAVVGTYPLIRAKVLQQTSSSKEQLSLMTIWRSILSTEGVLGLYRGLLAMSYKTVAWNAVMMAFKHALGPKRAVTPPASPPKLDPASLIPPMPWMARTPFPAELITVEKLDEILSYLKRDPHQEGRVQKLESRMNQMSEELREVRHLLSELVRNLSAISVASPSRT